MRPPESAARRMAMQADHAFGRVMRRIFRGGWGARLSHALHLAGRLEIESRLFPIGDSSTHAPLRVAFASDFHAGATTHPAIIAAACAALAAMQPDVLLLGGDFVAFDAPDIDALIPLLRSIPAPRGRFAVLGNHDVQADRAYIEAALAQADIQILANRCVRLRPPHDHIWICGLDDPTLGDPDADMALAGATGTRLVLMHSPDGLLALGNQRFDLACCGHTHGGQIALPGGRPIVVPRGRLSRRYCHGVFQLRDRAQLLVSRGVGCTSLPVRLFARPQVHACVIVT